MSTIHNLALAQWRKSSYSTGEGSECVECAPVGGAQWRKSSYSTGEGGDCVECAPVGGTQWRKSSYSTGEGSDCVEIAPLPRVIAVRDSKRPEGPALIFPIDAFAAFIREQV